MAQAILAQARVASLRPRLAMFGNIHGDDGNAGSKRDSEAVHGSSPDAKRQGLDRPAAASGGHEGGDGKDTE
eukprot:2834619-Karenia_brevis.AAC.1